MKKNTAKSKSKSTTKTTRARTATVSAKKAPIARAKAPKRPGTRRAAVNKTPSKAAAGAAVPKLGATAPRFSLPSDAGNNISPSDYGGRWMVLYFYPKDNTPGCTREALAFESAGALLADEGAVVVGVSRDSIATHCSFKAKQALRFPLLSDPSGQVHRLYGAYGQKMMYGKSITGALRTTAIIRPDGTLARLFQNVKVDGHADKVLAVIREEKKALGEPKGG
jgi:peroxiredoxin Q/BCP